MTTLKEYEEIPLGTIYGFWTIIGEPVRVAVGNGNTKMIMFPCRCECGAIRNVRARYLISGKSRSCGYCVKFQSISFDAIPVGTSFGRWTLTGPRILKMVGYKKPHTMSVFPCRCDCGTERLVAAANLVNGTTRGCRACMPPTNNAGTLRAGVENRFYKGENGLQRQKITWLIAEKSQPCVDCRHSFPSYCMQFDHVPERGKKDFAVNLNAAMSKYSLERLKKERLKCDLVCSVCHAHRTWERANGMEHEPLSSKHWNVIENAGDSV